MVFPTLVDPRHRFSELVTWGKFHKVYDELYAEMFEARRPERHVAEIELRRVNTHQMFDAISYGHAEALLAESGYRACTARETLEFVIQHRKEIPDWSRLIALGDAFSPHPDEISHLTVLRRDNQGGRMLELVWRRHLGRDNTTNGWQYLPAARIDSDIPY